MLIISTKNVIMKVHFPIQLKKLGFCTEPKSGFLLLLYETIHFTLTFSDIQTAERQPSL